MEGLLSATTEACNADVISRDSTSRCCDERRHTLSRGSLSRTGAQLLTPWGAELCTVPLTLAGLKCGGSL